MQFVQSKDLKPGMRLAKPIYNKDGVLLYERNTKLSEQVINYIQNFMLIGIYILEPAEPLLPLTREDIEFEQFQTISMFQLRNNINLLKHEKPPKTLMNLVDSIVEKYGSLDHKFQFNQDIRSSGDFVYKHAICVAILAAMISHHLGANKQIQKSIVMAGLLYDFGYIFVPQAILDKGDALSKEDENAIQHSRTTAYNILLRVANSFEFPENSLAYISQMVRYGTHTTMAGDPHVTWLDGTRILQVADAFDHMTAMNLNKQPLSELRAFDIIKTSQSKYDKDVVKALGACIHILPKGSCIDLQNGDKALVLEENTHDFSRPLILLFKDNSLFDLKNPDVYAKIRVKDVMKTMDNRIIIDEKTLEQFEVDDNLKKTTERYRKSKRRKLLRQRAQQVRS